MDAGSERVYLFGDEEADDLTGGVYDDWLEGADGADALDGGDGIDRAPYQQSSAGVIVNLEAGTGSDGEAEGDTLTNIEQVDGSDFGDVVTGDGAANLIAGELGDETLNGGAGDDYLYGGSGVDSLSGGADDDFLSGGIGGDALIGGDGIDTASYTSSWEGVNINLGANTTSGGEATGDTFSGIERILGSDYVDTLTGSYNDDQFA